MIRGSNDTQIENLATHGAEETKPNFTNESS